MAIRANNSWFTVDKEGLAKLMERRGVGFVLTELLQNAWDEDGVTRVEASLAPVKGRRARARLVIEDDAPDGFQDLADAYTLFAESYKKADATKRGRYNFGEKMVLALCESARIESTTGSVIFKSSGDRQPGRKRRAAGSRFEAIIRLTRAQVGEVAEAATLVLPPEGIETIFNGEVLQSRIPLVTFDASLPTRIADDEGVLRPTVRKTRVEVIKTRPGERAHVYEMGLPIEEIDFQWHINVMQKVPLGLERSRIGKAYLNRVTAHVLNHAFEHMDRERAASPQVQDAIGHPEISFEAYNRVLNHRFGPKRVMRDPSDPEAEGTALSKGYTVVGGNQLSRAERERRKEFQRQDRDPLVPAGQVFPSPKAWAENGKTTVFRVERSAWTDGMRRVEAYAVRLASQLIGHAVRVSFYPHMAENKIAATYCRDIAALDFNLKRLTKSWFEGTSREDLKRINELLIHEFAHEYCSNHLDHGFHNAMGALGAKLADLYLTGDVKPGEFGYGGE